MRKLETGQSILDAVAGQAKDLQRNVGARDRDRLDQYFTSVRELEQRMQMSREWERKPKPKVNASVPLDPASPKAYMDKVKLMYDMARLAFETDSTRSISLLQILRSNNSFSEKALGSFKLSSRNLLFKDYVCPTRPPNHRLNYAQSSPSSWKIRLRPRPWTRCRSLS